MAKRYQQTLSRKSWQGYSESQFASILSSYKRNNVESDPHIRAKFASIAGFYVDFAQERPEHRLPSEIRRELKAFCNKTTALNQAIAKIRRDADLWPEVYGAAEALADQDRGLLDYDADQVVYGQTVVPVWPVERQIENVERGLCWLIRVIGEAASRQEVVGHRPPDEPLNIFICGVEALYRDTAANPEIPSRDGRARKIRGELMQLLLACLTPLRPAVTGFALFARWKDCSPWRRVEVLRQYRERRALKPKAPADGKSSLKG